MIIILINIMSITTKLFIPSFFFSVCKPFTVALKRVLTPFIVVFLILNVGIYGVPLSP